MKSVLCLILLGYCLIPKATSQEAPSAFLVDSEQHSFVLGSNGNEYKIVVALPSGYRNSPDVSYPVVYSVSAGGSIFTSAESHRGQTLGREANPAIIVGFWNDIDQLGKRLAQRASDLTPTSDLDFDSRYSDSFGTAVKSGGASALLDGLVNEIIPFVENRYRTSESRMLAGYSLGGLFTVSVMLQTPELFEGYLLGSPSLWWESEMMYTKLESFLQTGSSLKGRIFISGNDGEGEPYLSQSQRFAELLNESDNPDLEVTLHIFEGETHLSGVAATMSRGLRVLLSPN